MKISIAIFVFLGFIAFCFGFGSAPGSCDLPGGSMGNTPTAGNGGFSLTTPASYTPGQTFSVTLSGTGAFKGFRLYATDSRGNRVGTYSSFPTSVGFTPANLACTATIGHSAVATFNSVTVSFTAPQSSSDLVFDVVVVTSTTVWYRFSRTVTASLVTTALQTTGLQTTAVPQQTTVAQQTTAIQTTALQTTGLQTTDLQTTALQTTGATQLTAQTVNNFSTSLSVSISLLFVSFAIFFLFF